MTEAEEAIIRAVRGVAYGSVTIEIQAGEPVRVVVETSQKLPRVQAGPRLMM